MKKTLLFYSLAIVTAATAMAGLRHTQKAPAALDAKLEALTAKPHSPSLREIGSEIVLVSEDFAKFTAGSEDDPDGTELSDWNDGTIDAKYTQQSGWRGGFVYQAGGCAYLDVDTEEGTGWLITPTLNLSNYGGSFTIKFRARVASSKSSTTDEIYVQNCLLGEYSNSVTSSQTIEGTTKWKEYTLTFTDGNSKDDIQITAKSYPIFIDDITITQIDNGKPGAPLAQAATNVSDTQFTANWQAVEGAEGYLLSVYTLKNATEQYLFKDKEVNGTSYDVTGIEANIDYYYTVCSKRNGETSNTSNTITVIRKLKTPVTLPATNVASYGFTANWQSVPQATAYAVYTILTHTAQADNEPFNLFKSDFSAVKVGTIDSPWDYSRLGGIRVFLDDLAPRCDWIAFAPMAAQGMFGVSNMFLDYNVPGTIYSPILDLGHDGGKSTLRFNVLGRNVTKLRICVLKDRADGKADELFKTECPVTTDLAEQVITLEKGEKDTYVEISIAEGTGYVLFDDLQLSQNLNKGESTELKYKYDETSDTSRRIDTPDYSAGDVYAYTVQAFRLDSSSKIIEEATSDRSEPQEVKRSDAVESITAGNDGATVATTADGIRITLAEAAPVAVYSLDGRLLHQDNTAATEQQRSARQPRHIPCAHRRKDNQSGALIFEIHNEATDGQTMPAGCFLFFNLRYNDKNHLLFEGCPIIFSFVINHNPCLLMAV